MLFTPPNPVNAKGYSRIQSVDDLGTQDGAGVQAFACPAKVNTAMMTATVQQVDGSLLVDQHWRYLRPQQGQVHSVFTHAINLSLDNSHVSSPTNAPQNASINSGQIVLCLSDKPDCLLPSSMLLNSADFARLRECIKAIQSSSTRNQLSWATNGATNGSMGDTLQFTTSQGQLVFSLSLANAQTYTTQLKHLPDLLAHGPINSETRTQLTRCLQQNSAFHAAPNPTVTALRNARFALRQTLSAQRLDESAVMRLLGLGPGLTPSGDDYLLGILLALFCRHRSWRNRSYRDFLYRAECTPFLPQLMTLIERNLTRTTDVSQFYLRQALAGRFSPLFVQLAEQILHNYLRADSLIALAQFGHSSGYDTLTGLVDGLTDNLTDGLWASEASHIADPILAPLVETVTLVEPNNINVLSNISI